MKISPIVYDLCDDTVSDDSEPEPFAEDDDGDNDPDFSPTTGDHALRSDDDMEDDIDNNLGLQAKDNKDAPQPPVALNHANVKPVLGVDGDSTLNCNRNSQLG